MEKLNFKEKHLEIETMMVYNNFAIIDRGSEIR